MTEMELGDSSSVMHATFEKGWCLGDVILGLGLGKDEDEVLIWELSCCSYSHCWLPAWLPPHTSNSQVLNYRSAMCAATQFHLLINDSTQRVRVFVVQET